MTFSLPDYQLDPPDDPPCRCGDAECDECRSREEAEAAWERHIDQRIDEAREREWED
jgi:hypothetical protein